MLIDTHVRLCPGASGADIAAHQRALGANEVWLRAIPGNPDACVVHNDAALGLVEQGSGVQCFCALHPALDNPLAELDRCLDAGMLGAGELDPVAQRFTLEDPSFCAIARRLEQRGAVLALHLAFSVGAAEQTYPIRAFAEFIGRYPALKVILSGYGGGLPFYELMKEMKTRLSNVVYDTAPGRRLLRGDAAAITVALAGSHKLAYGSGASVGSGCSHAAQRFSDLGMEGALAIAAVGHGNALRLTGRESA